MIDETPDGTARLAAIEQLQAMLPGPELVDLLQTLDVEELRDDFDVLEVIAAWDRVVSWASAQQLKVIAEFARRPSIMSPDPEAGWAARGAKGQVEREFADDEIAARLSISGFAANTRIELGASFATTLAATGDALEAGAIDLPRARAVFDATRNLPADTAREVEARVLPNAPAQNRSRLKQALRRAVIVADPHGAAHRRTSARSDRRVVITPLDDDMAELYAVLPALEAIAIETALTAAARALKADASKTGETRTMDQLRADLLAAPFNAALRTGTLDGVTPTDLARIGGERAKLNVTVPASVLLGISDAPGQLAGYGPISADTAREIAGDSTWRRILTDPVDGTLLDVGAETYRPPAHLARHVRMRDGTCRWVGCNWPAHRCELDHSVRHPDGPTADRNLGPFCKRHHIFKHRDGTGRCLVQVAPGVFTWTTPTGHSYTVTPPPIALPIHEELACRCFDPSSPSCPEPPKPAPLRIRIVRLTA